MKQIIALVAILASLGISSAYADSYQHFRNDSPLSLTLQPGETLFLNNNAGKVNELIIQTPDGTSKIIDSSVGNNGATHVQLNDTGQYTLYGADGLIGYVTVKVPEVIQTPSQTEILTPTPPSVVQNNTLSTPTPQVLPTPNTEQHTIQQPQETPIFSYSNQTTPIVSTPIVQNQTIVQNVTQSITEKLTQLQAQNDALKTELDDMKVKQDTMKTEEEGIFGMLTKIMSNLHIN